MTQKTFYNNYNTKIFTSLKFLNKKFYPKSWVRNEITTKQNLKTVDNYVSVKHILTAANTKEGYNFSTKDFIATNKNNKNLKLAIGLGSCNLTKNILGTHTKNIKQLVEKKKRKPTIILNSKKGGFSVCYSGMNGFLPQSQYKSAIQGLKKKQLLFFRTLNMKRFFPLRLPLQLSKITVDPTNTRNNFSNQSSQRTFNNGLNLVFVNKEQIQKKYENQTNKKNTWKYNNKLETKGKKVFFN